MAKQGTEWAVDKLLTRPEVTEQAAPFWAAFLLLSRDRPELSLSLGMVGGISVPKPIPRTAILREGERLGFEGEGLDDFEEIVMRVDDRFIEVTVKRLAAEMKTAAARAKKR